MMKFVENREHKVPREIPKKPPLPSNFNRAFEPIEKLIFPISPEPKAVDCIFVFGVIRDISVIGQHVSALANKLRPKSVIISGGKPNYVDGVDRDRSEAELIADHVNVPPTTEVLLEKNARHTLENVTLSKKLYDYALTARSTLIVCRTHHAGRAKLTFEAHVTAQEVFIAPFITTEGLYAHLERATWRSMVDQHPSIWGEVLRIQQYSQRGDLTISPHAQALLNEIREIISC